MKTFHKVPHEHRCIDTSFQGKRLDNLHVAHVWVCYRPECDSPYDYHCGIIADALVVGNVGQKENSIGKRRM